MSRMSAGPDDSKKVGAVNDEARQQTIPVSLGKPSLRRRLEAYYTLVAPDQIGDRSEWRARFDQIWAKFGGSHESERKLATKLVKKYGPTVQLELAESPTESSGSTQQRSSTRQPLESAVIQHPEDWFQLRDTERGSGDVCFTSTCFDPVAALRPEMLSKVESVNPAIVKSPILGQVYLFDWFLPRTDPQFRPLVRNNRASKAAIATTTPKIKPPNCFASIAREYAQGPLSVLYHAFVKRQRVRVVIRYVNGIRGTLTGFLLAFDKHMNMILRDVDEVYSPRPVTASDQVESKSSNVEIELHRRQQASRHQSPVRSSSWSLRQRHMKQILVRGDNVVLVYIAGEERSSWPPKPSSRVETMYRCKTVKNQVPPDQKIGSIGSLVYAAARGQLPNKKRGRRSDYASSG